jgi:predicted  nucleic acid-binding Zn-ribbon protein
VQDQFLLLTTLQQLDDRLHMLTEEQKKLPQQLQPYEQACLDLQTQLTSVQTAMEEVDRQRRALERQLDSDQGQLGKTQSKLREVKTNKEYSAVLTEIATGKQRIAALEDHILELMELAEQHRETLHRQAQQVEQATQELASQQQKIEKTRQAVIEQITTQGMERQQVVSRLDAKFYALYQRLATQRHGLVVVHVHDGTCGGCHLKVQPQLVSEIRRQDTLLTCPHCQRILLWPTQSMLPS